MPKFSIDVLSVIIFLGIAQGIFLSLVIMKVKKGNHKANRLLALLILCISIVISDTLILSTRIYHNFPYALHLYVPFFTVLGPLLYLYVKELVNYEYSLIFKDTLHFIPFLIAIGVMLPVYLQPGEVRINHMDNYILGTMMDEVEADRVWGAAQFQTWIYLILIWKMVKKHQVLLKNNFSTIDKINLSWVKYFVYWFVVIYIVGFLTSVLPFIGINQFKLDVIMAILPTICIYAIGYRGLNQPTIFYKALESKKVTTKKYEKSSLIEKELQNYKQKIINIMQEEKLYKDPNLTVDDLSKKLDILKNHVSQTINQAFNMNFYDFVNKYRVDEVKNEIGNSSSKINLLEFAFNAGFNSKSTFNSAFKKHTSLTPTQYKNELIQTKK